MNKKEIKTTIICRSEVEFEKIFLPLTHEKKKREKAMKEPKSFGEHLKEELTKRFRK